MVEKTSQVPPEVSAEPTVGVRIPNHALAREIIRAVGGNLAVTSANRTGEPVTLTTEEVLSQLDGAVDLVLGGERCQGGIPSTVLDCTVWPPVVLRAGAVPETAIQSTLERAGFAARHFQNKETDT